MVYSVNTVARYILKRTRKASGGLKLQKLTYYCQAWTLALTSKPLIEEEFEAWTLGPVCPELFDMLRGKYPIKKKDIPPTLEYDGDTLDEDAIDIVGQVLGVYNKFTGPQLSNLTHAEAPWQKARDAFEPGEKQATISKKSMEKYYGSLLVGEKK